jgi:hypothetical protein
MSDSAKFLESSPIVDWRVDEIKALAHELRFQANDELSVVRRAFEWVRDRVQHSGDFNRQELTCRASDVLRHGTGYCYAKSHLLAALLRANAIPTGFCYQRLSMSGEGPPYCLHGLSAVYLRDMGWCRLDARGNKQGVTCIFDPPLESLAYHPSATGEIDFPEIWAEPLPRVVESLTCATSVEELETRFPDMSESEMLDWRLKSRTPPVVRNARCGDGV